MTSKRDRLTLVGVGQLDSTDDEHEKPAGTSLYDIIDTTAAEPTAKTPGSTASNGEKVSWSALSEPERTAATDSCAELNCKQCVASTRCEFCDMVDSCLPVSSTALSLCTDAPATTCSGGAQTTSGHKEHQVAQTTEGTSSTHAMGMILLVVVAGGGFFFQMKRRRRRPMGAGAGGASYGNVEERDTEKAVDNSGWDDAWDQNAEDDDSWDDKPSANGSAAPAPQAQQAPDKWSSDGEEWGKF